MLACRYLSEGNYYSHTSSPGPRAQQALLKEMEILTTTVKFKLIHHQSAFRIHFLSLPKAWPTGTKLNVGRRVMKKTIIHRGRAIAK